MPLLLAPPRLGLSCLISDRLGLLSPFPILPPFPSSFFFPSIFSFSLLLRHSPNFRITRPSSGKHCPAFNLSPPRARLLNTASSAFANTRFLLKSFPAPTPQFLFRATTTTANAHPPPFYPQNTHLPIMVKAGRFLSFWLALAVYSLARIDEGDRPSPMLCAWQAWRA